MDSQFIQVYKLNENHPMYNPIPIGMAPLAYPNVLLNRYAISRNGFVLDMVSNTYCGAIPANEEKPNSGFVIPLITSDGITKFEFPIKRLVAYTFCSPPSHDTKILDKYILSYKDGNKYNTWCNNLEWVEYIRHVPTSYTSEDGVVVNKGKLLMNAASVHKICQLFQEGLTNTEVMNELGMEHNNANHMILRDIRNGSSWNWISSQYNFNKKSKQSYYNEEDIATIENLLVRGMSIKEVVKVIKGDDVSINYRSPEYRAVETIKAKLKKHGVIE